MMEQVEVHGQKQHSILLQVAWLLAVGVCCLLGRDRAVDGRKQRRERERTENRKCVSRRRVAMAVLFDSSALRQRRASVKVKQCRNQESDSSSVGIMAVTERVSEGEREKSREGS